MASFASVEELAAGLDWDLGLSEQQDGADALEYLSEIAREIGNRGWTPEKVPRLVKSTVLVAARRYIRNAEGYTQSRAGDETLTWSDQREQAGTPYFTATEMKLLRTLAGRSALYSMPTHAWGQHAPADLGYRNDDKGVGFPLFTSPESLP